MFCILRICIIAAFVFVFFNLTPANPSINYFSTNKYNSKLTNTQLNSSLKLNLSLGFSLFLFFNDGELDTVALGESDHGFSAFTNDENVGETSSEFMTSSIADVDNIEGTEVAITADNHTDTTDVVTLGDEAEVTDFELEVTDDLVGLEIDLHGITNLHSGIGEADGAGVVSNNEGNLLVGELALDDLAELEASFGLVNAVEDETTLDIIEKTETISTAIEGDDIHETSRVGGVGADLAIDLNKTLHADHLDFMIGESVLQTVTDNEEERQAFSLLVGTAGRLRSPNTTHLVKHPVLRGIQTL